MADDNDLTDVKEKYEKVDDAISTYEFVNGLTGNEPLMPEGYDKVTKPVNFALDAEKFAGGVKKMHESEDHSPEEVQGFHDALEGGSGMGGASDSKAGKLAKAFNVGFKTGDKIAPYVYGPEPTGEHTEPSTVDTPSVPSTGNKYVDKLFGVDNEVISGPQPGTPEFTEYWHQKYGEKTLAEKAFGSD